MGCCCWCCCLFERGRRLGSCRGGRERGMAVDKGIGKWYDLRFVNGVEGRVGRQWV